MGDLSDSEVEQLAQYQVFLRRLEDGWVPPDSNPHHKEFDAILDPNTPITKRGYYSGHGYRRTKRQIDRSVRAEERRVGRRRLRERLRRHPSEVEGIVYKTARLEAKRTLSPLSAEAESFEQAPSPSPAKTGKRGKKKKVKVKARYLAPLPTRGPPKTTSPKAAKTTVAPLVTKLLKTHSEILLKTPPKKTRLKPRPKPVVDQLYAAMLSTDQPDRLAKQRREHERRVTAATRIQRQARGLLARREVAGIKAEIERQRKAAQGDTEGRRKAARMLQTRVRGFLARRDYGVHIFNVFQVAKLLDQASSEFNGEAHDRAVRSLQRVARGWKVRNAIYAAKQARHRHATRIQSMARKRKARRVVAERREQHGAARRIQAIARRRLARSQVHLKRTQLPSVRKFGVVFAGGQRVAGALLMVRVRMDGSTGGIVLTAHCLQCRHVLLHHVDIEDLDVALPRTRGQQAALGEAVVRSLTASWHADHVGHYSGATAVHVDAAAARARVRDLAALRLQRFTREAHARQHSAVEQRRHEAAVRIQAVQRQRTARSLLGGKRRARAELHLMTVEDARSGAMRSAADLAAVEARRAALERHDAAAKVQSLARGRRDRQRATAERERRAAAAAETEASLALTEQRRREHAATAIQARARGLLVRNAMREGEAELEAAAVAIQRVVRGRQGRQRYRRVREVTAEELGIMVPMPGTLGGRSGWYRVPHTTVMTHFIVSPDGNWLQTVKPMEIEYWRYYVEMAKCSEFLVACPGTEQGYSGMYLDGEGAITQWEVSEQTGEWTQIHFDEDAHIQAHTAGPPSSGSEDDDDSPRPVTRGSSEPSEPGSGRSAGRSVDLEGDAEGAGVGVGGGAPRESAPSEGFSQDEGFEVAPADGPESEYDMDFETA